MKTDAQLQKDVIEELQWDPTVILSDINVAAKDGVVTLSGTVPHYAAKLAAERATQRVNGVIALAVEIEVHPARPRKRKESDIAQAVINAHRWLVRVPSRVQATIENGWVMLSSNVNCGHERNAAADATHLSRVNDVSSDTPLS